MATTTNIPPQAYTRDTLVKAIEWISHQSPTVRERANSADLIVSFYLQARRRMTAAQMETPVSGETFKQDLKHLAQDLKQFEEIPTPPQPHRPYESSEMHTHNHLHTAPSPQQHTQQHVHLHVQPAPPPPQTHAPQVHHNQIQPPPHTKGVSWNLDARSLSFAREIQERFNLSSEGEALRLLITLGIERAREIFP